MPGRREPDRTAGHSLGLQVDGVLVTMLSGVTGLAMERDVIELKENGPDGRFVIKKLPGGPRTGEVIVTRDLSEDRAFEQWVDDVSHGSDTARRHASIVVFNRRGDPVATFTLAHAWPRKLEFAGLRAGGSDVVMEELVLVHEGIDRA